MLLYNVTIGIDRDIEGEWLEWMQQKHIPDVLKTGMFHSYKLYRILDEENGETISYSIQYFAKTIDDVLNYLENHAPALVEEHRLRYKNKHVAFRTLLEEV